LRATRLRFTPSITSGASRDANPNRDANPSLRHNNGAPNRSLPSRTSDTIPSHANHIANSPPFRWD
jgi:hypothetical protein